MNCFAICPITYSLAKLAERWSSAQSMKRSSPHRMTRATSSISSHEEADTRILLHVAHCARQGAKTINVFRACLGAQLTICAQKWRNFVLFSMVSFRFVLSRVCVFLYSLGPRTSQSDNPNHRHRCGCPCNRNFLALRLDKLWVSFGVCTHFRQIAIHEIVKNVNEKVLMFFHAVSGCDTVSSFLGRGKKSARLASSSCPSVTYAFLDLSLQPVDVSSEKIERFIVVMYSRKCSASGVNEAGKELFAQCSRTMENIPPTKAALLQHVRRAEYQLGYVWSQALVPVRVLPSPAFWGWLTSDSGWKPFWTELPEAYTACYERVHCGCKKGCRRQCECRSLNRRCTELCKCSGACGDNLQ